MKQKKARVLLFDVETMANLAYVWGKYEQDVIQYEQEWYMLCFAYKWLGEKTTHAFSLPDFSGYQSNRFDDKKLLKKLWQLFDEADIIIAHNGDQFDIKKANARFIAHGLNAPSPYKTIDTKKVAKQYFNFNSNKLDDLGRYFGFGRKLKTDFDLWMGCVGNDPTSWEKMVRYNKRDVDLLEKVYLRMRPWMANHPNLNVVNGTLCSCPACSSTNLQKRGFSITRTAQKQRYQCIDCGAWSLGKSITIKDLIIR